MAELERRARRREALFSGRDADGEGRYRREARTEVNGAILITGASLRDDGGGFLPIGNPHPFGLRLRTIRQERGMSMKRLARRSGVSLAALSRLETGQRNRRGPSLGVLVALADALQISLDRLVGRMPPCGA